MRQILVLSAILCGTCISAADETQPTSSTHAFNVATGTLHVDYAGYLSKHDVVFNAPITNPAHGLTVGNGRVGAQVWNANGLTMQISGVDASEQSCFSEGIVNLYTTPGMDEGCSTFQQRLCLYDGVVVAKYDSNRTVTIMGSPNSEVMGIHVEDSRAEVSNVTLDVSIWDLDVVKNIAVNLPDINTWKTVATYADADGAGISRGQTDKWHFGYTLAASVEGATFTTSAVDSRKVRLSITPTSSYTIWIASASRLNAPDHDSVARAKSLLAEVKSAGYAATLSTFKNWWHDFWGKSFVQYSNAAGDADYLENFYYLANYIIGSGAFGNYPFHFIHGVYSCAADKDFNHWTWGYWYWNQRCVYNSFLASNRASAMESFYNLYSRNFDELKSSTLKKYKIDGIRVPETMGCDGSNKDGGEATGRIYSTGAEVAQNMYMRYKYTNDKTFLAHTAYPLMKEVCKFYCGRLSYDKSTGKYFMEHSNGHESYRDVTNPITDLVAVCALFPITIQTSVALNLDSDLRGQWQKVLDNLVPYDIGRIEKGIWSPLEKDASPASAAVEKNIVYLPCAPPVRPGRAECINCELLWPYSVTGIADPIAINSWNNRISPYANIWAADAIQAARAGLGEEAFRGMKHMLAGYQSYPNGLTSDGNGDFEYVGLHPSAMNESLLHSYSNKIRVFPAVPSDASFVSKFTLLASGGFLVSSEKEGSDIKYVGIKSLYGNPLTLINPWGDEQLQVRRAFDNAIQLTSSKAEVTFPTERDRVYLIERTAKLLSSYPYGQITGAANQGAKTFKWHGNKRSLGCDTVVPSK